MSSIFCPFNLLMGETIGYTDSKMGSHSFARLNFGDHSKLGGTRKNWAQEFPKISNSLFFSSVSPISLQMGTKIGLFFKIRIFRPFWAKKGIFGFLAQNDRKSPVFNKFNKQAGSGPA